MPFRARTIFLTMLMLVPRALLAQLAPAPPLFPPPQAPAALPAPAEPATSAPEADPLLLPPGKLPEGFPPEETFHWYEPRKWLLPAPWDTAVELGINGSSGTSESLSVRTGGYMKRESRFSKLKMSSYYNRTTKGGTATQNNATFDVRNDWLLDDKSPWTLFGATNIFYDQFQAFDVQSNGNMGVGYRFVSDPELELVARLGVGVAREFGGPDERWVPESLAGFEYSQKLSTTQKFYGKFDYFPEWDQIGEYRMVADVGWEIALIEPSNLSLKLSASDRFDSTPNGANPHVVNYSLLLLLRL